MKVRRGCPQLLIPQGGLWPRAPFARSTAQSHAPSAKRERADHAEQLAGRISKLVSFTLETGETGKRLAVTADLTA